MKKSEYVKLAESFADHRLQLAIHERESYTGVLTVALKNRIELIRDYAVFSTALLASIVAIFSAKNHLGADDALLILAGLLNIISIICCFVSRIYYVQEGDDQLLNINLKFGYEVALSQAMKFSESSTEYEKRKSEIKEPEENITQKWTFFIDDTKNIGVLISISVLALLLSFIV